MVHRTSGSTPIGREKELDEMFDDLRHDNSIRLMIGESGIGKSALLDEFHRALTVGPNLSFGTETSAGLIDFTFKIAGGAVTFGLIIIDLTRKFERKFRHESK